MATKGEARTALIEWLSDELKRSGRGARSKLAAELNLDPSAITLMTKGERNIFAEELILMQVFFESSPKILDNEFDDDPALAKEKRSSDLVKIHSLASRNVGDIIAQAEAQAGIVVSPQQRLDMIKDEMSLILTHLGDGAPR